MFGAFSADALGSDLAALFNFSAGSFTDKTGTRALTQSGAVIVTPDTRININPFASIITALGGWQGIGIAGFATGETDPYGGATAFKISEDGTNGNHVWFSGNTVITAGDTITAYYVVKPKERSANSFIVQDGGGNFFLASWDFSTGVFGGNSQNGTAVFISSTCIPFGNGYYLVMLTGKVDPAQVGVVIGGYINVAGSIAYQGTAGFGFDCWRCGLLDGGPASFALPGWGVNSLGVPSGDNWLFQSADDASRMRIAGGVLTNVTVAAVQSAGYFEANNDKGINRTRIGCKFKLVHGATGVQGAGAMFVFTNPNTDPTALVTESGFHFAFQVQGWILSNIIGGVFTQYASGNWLSLLNYGQEYSIDARLDLVNSKAQIFLPDGTIANVADPSIKSKQGPIAGWETFQQNPSSDDRVGFTQAWFK